MLQAAMREAMVESTARLAGYLYDEDARERYDWNLAIAVQRQMLPRSSKRLSRVEFAGVSTAAHGLGGDYYDFLDLGPGRLGVVVADVSGKGVAAALLMANLQALIRSECAHGHSDLEAMLRRVHTHFFAATLPHQFATLFFAVYEEASGRLTYINCGHQPAIVRRIDGSVETLDATALPIGVFECWGGEARSIELRPGDSLYVCSDGVVEAGIENGCEFGQDGLTSIIAGDPELDMECSVSRIARAACAHAPQGLADDMTIVGMRISAR